MNEARRQVAVIALVQVLAMATWFSATAVTPALRHDWTVSGSQATWLTSSVQLGFVVGAVVSAVITLADLVPAPRLIAASALVAAAATAAIAVLADGVGAAIPLRFLTGVALAGVYPPGLRVMASWTTTGRGQALGVLVGALTLGGALPHLVNSQASLPWRGVLGVAAGLGALAAAIALVGLRTGPFATPATRVDPRYALTLLRDAPARLAILGYLGHMWELYAMWTWIPAYLAASAAASGQGGSRTAVGLTAFAVIGVAGAAGCLAGGVLGDRYGRARVAGWAMRASATSCLGAAWVFGGPPALVTAVLLVWGATVIADSGLFSTSLADLVEPHMVGTALTIQTAAGFLLTVVTINSVPVVVDAVSWRAGIALLSLGPIAGAVAMARLAIREQAPRVV